MVDFVHVEVELWATFPAFGRLQGQAVEALSDLHFEYQSSFQAICKFRATCFLLFASFKQLVGFFGLSANGR